MPDSQKILLVNNGDSNDLVIRYIREKLIIHGGYSVSFEFTAESGVGALRQELFDIVIIRLDSLGANEKEVILAMKELAPECIIIILVENVKNIVLADALRFGVYDVIDKTTDLEKLFFLMRKGLELRSLTLSHNKLMQSLKEQNVSLQKQNTLLAKRIEESTKNLSRLYEDLRSTYMRTIKVLAQAIDARDHYTHSHSENVARYAAAIAEELGLNASDIEKIREACELHDLGKIGIEDNILGKPAALTEQEWKQIKRHPLTGAQILEPLTFLNGVIDLVRQHHEHYDGLGYPAGLKGDDILLGARILNLADAYEAMTSARSYRKIPLTKEEAITEIKNNNGKQFDPKIVDAFLKIVDSL